MLTAAMSDADLVQSTRLDKSAFAVLSRAEATEDDRAYCLSKAPEERGEAIEHLRQIHYGDDPTATRLQRVLTIVERGAG